MWSLLLSVAASAQPAPAAETAAVPEEEKFNAEELRALHAGEVVWRQTTRNGKDRGVATVVTRATPKAVWALLRDFDRWHEFLPYITASEKAREGEHTNHPDFDVAFELTVKGIVTKYLVRHHFHPDLAWMPFEVVEAEMGPLKGATGYWRTMTWPDGRTVLQFQAETTPLWFVPARLRRKAATGGLPRLVKIMAKELEREAP